jgi:hypothetical protein
MYRCQCRLFAGKFFVEIAGVGAAVLWFIREIIGDKMLKVHAQ